MDPRLIRGLRQGLAESRERQLRELAARRGWITSEQLAGQEPIEHLLTFEKLEVLKKEAETAEAPPSEVAEHQANPESVLGKYVLVKKLGQGGMGEVWKSWDTVLGRWVAIKVLKNADEEDIPRLLREASLASKLAHPNVAVVYEASGAPPRPYIAMQYIEGEDLDAKVHRDGPLKISQALEFVRKIALALDSAHRQSIVHRDIKPSNIIIDGRNEPMLVDFGIARKVGQPGTLTAKGILCGTPCFMSPEQARGRMDLDARSDVFSLGSTLYALLVGTPPFDHTSPYESLHMVVGQELPSLRKRRDDLDVEVDTIVRKAMEKEPERRYQSAAELAEDLGRYLRGEPILARPTGFYTRFRKTVRRHPLVATLSALCAVALVALAFLGLHMMRAQRLAELEIKLKRLVERRANLLDRMRAGAQEPGTADSVLADLEREASALIDSARDFVRALDFRGSIRDQKDDLDGAESDFNACLAKNNKDVEALTGRGGVFLLRYARLAPAPTIELIQGVRGVRVRFEPVASKDPEANRWRDRARRDLDRAIQLNQEQDDARYALGQLFFLDGDATAAREILTKVIQGEKFYPKAYYFLGVSLLMLGDAAGTIEQLNHALTFGCRWACVYVYRALAYAALGNWRTAILDATKAIEMQPGSSDVVLNRVSYFVAAGQLQQAEEDLSKLQDSSEVFLSRAHVELRQGKLDEALKDIDAAAKLDPVNHLIPFERGNVLDRLGRTQEALDAYNAALKLRPNHPETLSNRAIVRRKLKDFDGALGDSDAAVRIDPNNPITLLTRAETRYLKHDYKGVVEDTTQAIRLDDRFPEAYARRGECRFKLIDRASVTRAELKQVVDDLERALDLKAELRAEFGALLDFAKEELSKH